MHTKTFTKLGPIFIALVAIIFVMAILQLAIYHPWKSLALDAHVTLVHILNIKNDVLSSGSINLEYNLMYGLFLIPWLKLKRVIFGKPNSEFDTTIRNYWPNDKWKPKIELDATRRSYWPNEVSKVVGYYEPRIGLVEPLFVLMIFRQICALIYLLWLSTKLITGLILSHFLIYF